MNVFGDSAWTLAVVLWIMLAIGAVPRMFEDAGVVAIVVMLGGAVIIGIDQWLRWNGPWPGPAQLMIETVSVVLAAVMAAVHSEILFRRANGYWRFVGPPRTPIVPTTGQISPPSGR